MYLGLYRSSFMQHQEASIVITFTLTAGAENVKVLPVPIALVFGVMAFGDVNVLLMVCDPVSCVRVPEEATLLNCSWNVTLAADEAVLMS